MKFGTVSAGRYTGADRYTGVAVGRRSTVFKHIAKCPGGGRGGASIMTLDRSCAIGHFLQPVYPISTGNTCIYMYVAYRYGSNLIWIFFSYREYNKMCVDETSEARNRHNDDYTVVSQCIGVQSNKYIYLLCNYLLLCKYIQLS